MPLVAVNLSVLGQEKLLGTQVLTFPVIPQNRLPLEPGCVPMFSAWVSMTSSSSLQCTESHVSSCTHSTDIHCLLSWSCVEYTEKSMGIGDKAVVCGVGLSRPAHCQWGCWGARRAASSHVRESCCCCSWYLIYALMCRTCFCCPGAVWVAHKHAVVLWYPVVSQKPCHLLCSFVRWTDQHLLHHGRQHRWFEAEARWPGIQKHAAKKVVRKRIKHGFVGSLWRMFQLYGCRSTNLLLITRNSSVYWRWCLTLVFFLSPFISKAFVLIWEPWSIWYRAASPTPAASPADCTTKCCSTPKETPQVDPATCGSVVFSE